MYDIITIGSSPKIFFKTAHYAKQGKKVLIVDADSAMGGNWQVTSFAGAENVELGGFIILGNKQIYSYMESVAGITLKTPTYPPMKMFAGKLYLLGNLWTQAVRLIKKNKKPITIFKALIFALRHIKRVIKHEYVCPYPERGVASILKRYEELSQKLGFEVRLNTHIDDVYVDFATNTIHLTDSEGHQLQTKKLIVGNGLDLDILKSDRYNLVINEGRIVNLFTFVLIAVRCAEPLKFSYVDFRLQHTNRLNDEDLGKINFERPSQRMHDFEVYLMWRVTHITPYSTLDETEDTKLLCVDTDGWLPKATDEEAMTIRLLEYLADEGLLPSSVELLEFEWHRKVGYSNPGLEETLNRYFSGVIEGNKTAVLADNPKAV